MAQELITLFSGTSGLDNRIDPNVMIKDERGHLPLSACSNTVVDDSGIPSRRSGFSTLYSGSYHSLTTVGNNVFVVEDRASDAAIFKVGSDNSLFGVRSGLTLCSRMCFLQSGDDVYYTNGHEKGIIRGGVSRAWFKGDYDDLDTTRVLSSPPTGNHLCIYNGRMLISEGSVAWFSDYGRYDLYEKSRSFFRYHTPIRMLCRVSDGVYVSSSEHIYFVSGEFPESITSKLVSNRPAIEWSDVSNLLDPVDTGLKDPSLCALWVDTEGVCLGLPGGVIIQVNKDKIRYPGGLSVGAGLLNGRNYIHSLL
jgi:hypothetical protein